MVELTTNARYPELLEPLAELLAPKRKPKPSEERIRSHFEEACRNIRLQLLQGLAEVAQSSDKQKSAASPPRGKVGRPEERLAKTRDEFRRLAYILTQLVKQPEVWAIIRGIVHRESGGRPASSKNARFISDILHHIMQTSASGDVEMLHADAPSTIANQLAYALKHEVPFPFLIGFLKEVRMSEAARKEREGLYEEWHPKWKAPTDESKAVAETKAATKKISSNVSKAVETVGKVKKTPTKPGKAGRSLRKATA